MSVILENSAIVQTSLEKAIKQSLLQNQETAVNPQLLPQILATLDYQQQLLALKPKLWAWAGFVLGSLGLMVFALVFSIRAFSQTATAHYLLLVFTDFRLVLDNWQDFGLSILESLPLGASALLLSAILAAILLIDFSSHQFGNLRKLLNSHHYGQSHK